MGSENDDLKNNLVRSEKFQKHEAECLARLTKIIEEKGKVKIPKHEQCILLRCLRARKNDVDKAVKLVHRYYIIKNELMEKGEKFKASHHIDFYNSYFGTCGLPRDSKGRFIALFRAEGWDPQITTFDDLFCATYLMADEASKVEETQFNGIIIIMDCKGFTLAQLRQCTPFKLRLLAQTVQESFPLRIKQVHIVNYPSIFQIVYSIIKPFLKEKMRNRVLFHSKLSHMHEYLSPEILPDYLDGQLTHEQFKDHSMLERLLEAERSRG